MAILTKPKHYKTGDAITAKVINDVIETAVAAYRLLSLKLLETSSIELSKLSFNIIDGDLIVSYDGTADLDFTFDSAGNLILGFTSEETA